jgi:hypothetical protein
MCRLTDLFLFVTVTYPSALYLQEANMITSFTTVAMTGTPAQRIMWSKVSTRTAASSSDNYCHNIYTYIYIYAYIHMYIYYYAATLIAGVVHFPYFICCMYICIYIAYILNIYICIVY